MISSTSGEQKRCQVKIFKIKSTSSALLRLCGISNSTQFASTRAEAEAKSNSSRTPAEQRNRETLMASLKRGNSPRFFTLFHTSTPLQAQISRHTSYLPTLSLAY